jgi:PKD repeat protein
MKRNIFSGIMAIGLMLTFSQCTKSVPELSGTASVADFAFAQFGISDTLPYTYNVRFTNQSSEEFLYQWNFGDNSELSSTASPTHTFALGGTYDVSLTTVGTNGNNTVTKKVFVRGACENDFFNKLTACAVSEWTWSFDADAVKVLSADATQVFFAGPAANCQVDDVYKFNANGTFTYEANGATFDVQSGYSCQPAKVNATSFKVATRTGQRSKIILGATSNGVGRPFFGTTDVVANNTYEIMSYTADNMVVRAVLPDNNLIEFKFKKNVALTLADVKTLLTGANGKGWKLDGTNGANSIIVGTESNPAQYFGGGPIEDCQKDDIYTFFPNNSLTYNANGQTFNGGNIAPNYNCGDNRSYTANPFTFGAVPGGRAGLATIVLAGAVPARFIGTTDIPENNYRIIDISPTKMTLRAGSGSGDVFQFKFVAN